MKRIMLLLLVVLTSVTAWAQQDSFVSAGLRYEVVAGYDYDAVQVVQMDNGVRYSGDIVIPQEVANGATTYRVVRVGASAFAYCRSLTSIAFPTGLREIGSNAFSGCSALREINLPEGVVALGGFAFNGCTALETTVIPSTLVSVGDTPPFKDCTGTAVIRCNVPNYSTLMKGSMFVGIDVAEGVTSIGTGAFSGCAMLATVSFPSTLQRVGSNLFATTDCRVTDITLPASLTEIGSGAFAYAGGVLTVNCSLPDMASSAASPFFNSTFSAVRFGPDVTRIGSRAFLNCRDIRTVELPAALTDIGSNAFCGCAGLAGISLPEGISTVPVNCFKDCTSLAVVRIPSTVATLAAGAFAGCSALTDVYAHPDVAPSIQYSTFDATVRESATLHVPMGSLSSYEASSYWARFARRVEEHLATDAPLGDVDGDGAVTLRDVEVLVGRVGSPVDGPWARCDLNGDSRCSIADVARLIRLLQDAAPGRKLVEGVSGMPSAQNE